MTLVAVYCSSCNNPTGAFVEEGTHTNEMCETCRHTAARPDRVRAEGEEGGCANCGSSRLWARQDVIEYRNCEWDGPNILVGDLDESDANGPIEFRCGDCDTTMVAGEHYTEHVWN